MKIFYEGQVLTAADLNDNFAEAASRPRILTDRSPVVVDSSLTGSTEITFPAGYFTDTPRVSVATLTTNPSTTQASIGGVSTSGFILHCSRPSAGTTNVDWIAVQA